MTLTLDGYFTSFYLYIGRRWNEMGANYSVKGALLDTFNVVMGDDICDQDLELKSHEPTTRTSIH